MPVHHERGCWLLLICVAERQSGESWRRIAIELTRLQLVTLQGEAGTVRQTPPLTQPQSEILAALGIDHQLRDSGEPRIVTFRPSP